MDETKYKVALTKIFWKKRYVSWSKNKKEIIIDWGSEWFKKKTTTEDILDRKMKFLKNGI